MAPLIAHGSGADDIIAFLAAPAIFLLYQGVKRLRRRWSRETAETDHQDQPDAPKGA